MMMRTLNPSWLIVRGVLSVFFGALVFVWPGPSLLAIALLWGAYAFVDGISAISTATRQNKWLVLEGALGMAAGIVTLFWPGITLFALSILVGVWALATGVLELIAAISSEAVAARTARGGRVLLGLAGVVSIALGVAVFATPALGALALLSFVAIYSVAFGVATLALGIKVRREMRELGAARSAQMRSRRAA